MNNADATLNDAKGKILSVCPKCKEQALETYGRRGRDDYGEIEGEQSYCHKCGYEDEWASRC